MRILVLTINFWPEQTGIGVVLARRCEYLASAGHEVTVCTAMPYYPEWRVHRDYAHKWFLREERNAVTILRSRIWVPKRVNSAKRVVFEASFLASSLLRAIANSKPDLLLAVSPPLGLGLSAVLLSRWWKIPYVFDVQDLQPDAAADLGMLPRPMLPVLYGLERLAYRNSALISTVTEGMRQKIISKGIPPTRVVVVPPPCDKALFGVGSTIDGHEFRRKHGLEGKFVVAHSGNMGVKQGLDLIIDVALHVRDRPQFVFLLVGDGAMKQQLQARVAGLQLTSVRFLPLQEQAEFLKMLAAVDLSLIVQQSVVSDIVFPSKVVTVLSAARPVVASVNGNSEVAQVIHQSGGGVVTEPENAEALVMAIQEFFERPGRRLAMGECGRQYATQHWDEARVLANFEAHLLNIGRSAHGAIAERSVSLSQ